MSSAPIRSFIQARDPSVDRRFRPRPMRRVNLIKLISEDEEENDSWSDTESEHGSETTESISTSSNSTQTDGALVYLRLRPTTDGVVSSSYTTDKNVFITRNSSDRVGKNLTEKHFTFSDIISSSVPQASVYDTCIRKSIETEENLTILTYGTSGSGKTYTQIGNTENPGLIPRALEHIFTFYGSQVQDYPCVSIVNAAINFLNVNEIEDHVKLRRKVLVATNTERCNHERLKDLVLSEHGFESNDSEEKRVFVWVSFAEIYNEMVYDLLNPSYEQQLSKKKGLTIVSNKGQVFIKNLTSICVRNSFEAQLLLRAGTQRITFGSTAVNNHSSRSHFVFFIDVITVSPPDVVEFHSYKFCDLAGSERLHKTQNVGNRLKEAQRINTSLLVLGRCLDAVYHNQQKKNADVVPYRESKLTTLLQAPLVGKEKMTMIVNINPLDEYFEENLNVLSFASIAKNIIFKQKPKKLVKRSRYSWLACNVPLNQSLSTNENTEYLREEIKILNNEVENLTNEVARLERELTTQEMSLRKELISGNEAIVQRIEENWRRRLDQQKNYYEGRIQILQDQLKNQRNFYEEKIRTQQLHNKSNGSPKDGSIYVTDSGSDADADDSDLN